MGPDYETLLDWQANILGGGEKPKDLTPLESRMYDNMVERLKAAGEKGYVVERPPD